MEDARKLGERNWRNAAKNRDSCQKLLKKALVQNGCCANDDDDDDNDDAQSKKHQIRFYNNVILEYYYLTCNFISYSPGSLLFIPSTAVCDELMCSCMFNF